MPARSDRLPARTIRLALSGEGAHADGRHVFEAIDWKLAGVRTQGAGHSLFELLNHLVYWQDWVLKWLDGAPPPLPKHASGGWPGNPGPASRKEWNAAVRAFRKGLDALDRGARESDLFGKQGKKSRLEMLHAIASHNSYHLGQAVLLRQMLGAWPPPQGSLTW